MKRKFILIIPLLIGCCLTVATVYSLIKSFNSSNQFLTGMEIPLTLQAKALKRE
ncbi:MAG: hypothetical protein QXY88_01320 [Candidatus Bathyarchaeia archaeon]